MKEKETEMKTVPNKYHTHISSKHNLFNLNLKEVWKYRDLIWLFTKRSFALTYKQTILGPLWIFFNPVISSLIYAIVFGGIAGFAPEGTPVFAYYLASNAVWTFFSTCVTQNASTFTANAAVFGKVYFPRLTVPISNMISSVVQFLIQFVMAILCMAASWIFVTCGLPVTGFGAVEGVIQTLTPPQWELIPLILLVLIHLGALGLGVGVIVSSLTTKYRDLSILVTFGVQLWMYITPVVYPLTTITDEVARTVMMYNPVTPPIELFRAVLFGADYAMLLDPSYLIAYGVSILVTIVLLFGGIMIFNKVERTFSDTV
ncbi:MAG: ABC transporter permease [Clostridia bacterium]|nr:ABC transporter permease [Clostridia bacterium]